MFDTTNTGTEVETQFAAVRAGIAKLSTDGIAEWHGDTLSDRLVALLELRERLDAEVARSAAVWSRRRAWEADGALSAVSWLAHRAPLSRLAAQRVVRAAKVLNASPQLGEALASNATTSAHVHALGRVVSPQRVPVLVEHSELLAKQAETLSISDFTLLARRWAALADDQLAADRHGEAEPPRNELRAGVSIGGRVVGDFDLDPISGAQLLGALDHLEPPDPVDTAEGPRSLSQRRGDALAELAGRYHDGGVAGSNPPNLDTLVDVATLSDTAIDLAKARCDLEGVGPITREVLEQLKCTATVRRLVMAGDSVVLDMGRKVRLATAAQTRAIRIRDGACVFAGCGRRPQWCDVHHIDGWAKGGSTDVARMCLLCRRHHTLIHNTSWNIETGPDGMFRTTHPIRAP